jgi:hypothetical protein
MSKCEFVYEAPPGPFFDYPELGQQVILRCTTHNCTTIIDQQTCLIGRIEALEERVAQLERPQSNISIDELGNPFSLRKPAKLEGD